MLSFILVSNRAGCKFYQLAVCLLVVPSSAGFSVAPFLYAFANCEAPPQATELETVLSVQQEFQLRR